jgi:dTDP-4-amino-4,6-dideoxygalactose transaminase
MLGTSFSPWPDFSEAEAEIVANVLRSNRVNYWTGNEGKAFELEFAQYFDSKFAVAMANGTLALESALEVLGIGSGDEVIVTPRTFIASASCVTRRGATPVFADICRDSQNITAETVARVMTERTRAIIAVHLAGWPCEMEELQDLAKSHGVPIVEDCAQAHGARYKGKHVGTFGVAAAWSFCQDKIMTTGGEGGMVTTNDETLWSALWSLKDHGKSYAAVNTPAHRPGFRWLHESFGTNWRMTEMQSAIGRYQLERMPEWSRIRQNNAACIWQAAVSIPGLRVPVVPTDIEHAAYKCYVFVEQGRLREAWSRDRIIAEINALNVPCYSGSCSEVYLEKAFSEHTGRPRQRLPVAVELGETSLMFLVHPTMKDTDLQRTIDVLESVMKQAIR